MNNQSFSDEEQRVLNSFRQGKKMHEEFAELESQFPNANRQELTDYMIENDLGSPKLAYQKKLGLPETFFDESEKQEETPVVEPVNGSNLTDAFCQTFGNQEQSIEDAPGVEKITSDNLRERLANTIHNYE